MIVWWEVPFLSKFKPIGYPRKSKNVKDSFILFIALKRCYMIFYIFNV